MLTDLHVGQYFTNMIKLSWKKLIIFAIIIGIYTGIVAMLPFLKDTSFQDISISFERWILIGLLIILNSESPKDSALKCFIFFLISQPIVYLVQIPFSSMGFKLFVYYKYWFIWTILTLPMGYIGYYIKKDNFLSLLVLLPMLIFDGTHLYYFVTKLIYAFPRYLYSTLFCLIALFVYVNYIFKNKKVRLLGNIICIIICITAITLGYKYRHTYNVILKFSSEELYFDDTYDVSFSDDQYGPVDIELYDLGDEKVYIINATFIKSGKTTMILKNDQHQYTFDLIIYDNTYELKLLEK